MDGCAHKGEYVKLSHDVDPGRFGPKARFQDGSKASPPLASKPGQNARTGKGQ